MAESAGFDKLSFLSGGGEMGELIRSRDWSKTSLGDPKDWSPNLRSTLSLLLYSKFPMFLWWGEDMVQFYNDAYRPSLGIDGKHPLALGQTAKECWPETWEVIYPLFQQVREKQATWSEDQFIPFYRNGKIEDAYWTFSYSPILDDQGSVQGILAICTETTEKVKAIKQVEEAYNRFVVLSEVMPQIVWTAKPDGTPGHFNKQWCDYSGLTLEESIQHGWPNSIHPEDLLAVIDKWKKSVQTGELYESEARLKRADGKYRWFLIRALPFKENGKITQWVGTSTDLQDKKSTEEQLQQLSIELKSRNAELIKANQQLTLINADLDNFIYSASHDLKAPISNIEGLMKELVGYLPQDIDQEVDILKGLIDTSIEKFKKTINHLTDITRLQKEYDMVFIPVKLEEIMKEVQHDLQLQIAQSNALIEIDKNTCVTIHFPRKSLKVIIDNLLSNAIKYRALERRLYIQISCKQEPDYQVISITDNGLGIDLSNKSKLFAMFSRLHDHVEGSGIGLYIVKKMIENAGGKIEVESKLGEGSTFKVYFKNNSE